MPAYDYRCDACEEVFEVNRPMSEEDAVCCPTCGGGTRRVFSPVGVAFKGTGFHNTDYREKPADEAAPCGASASDGGACATCPAAKTE
jgi:putative FmdB family regulatory protein